MQWFKVEKVKNPSQQEKLPPDSKLVAKMSRRIMDKAEIPLYRILNYESQLCVYAIPNHFYFLVRQYMIDKHTKTSALHSEYRLTLTEDAWDIVDALLRARFKCTIKLIDKGTFRFITEHPVLIPSSSTASRKGLQESQFNEEEGRWVIEVYVSNNVPRSIKISRDLTTIPFNCGPLHNLWLRAVDCWVEKLKFTPRWAKLVDIISLRSSLLEYKFIDTSIVPHYSLY